MVSGNSATLAVAAAGVVVGLPAGSGATTQHDAFRICDERPNLMERKDTGADPFAVTTARERNERVSARGA